MCLASSGFPCLPVCGCHSRFLRPHQSSALRAMCPTHCLLKFDLSFYFIILQPTIFNSSPIDGDVLGTYIRLVMAPSFWFLNVLVVVACLLPDYVVRVQAERRARRHVRPHTSAQELFITRLWNIHIIASDLKFKELSCGCSSIWLKFDFQFCTLWHDSKVFFFRQTLLRKWWIFCVVSDSGSDVFIVNI